jgi:DNA-binding response OmpR family regulator
MAQLRVLLVDDEEELVLTLAERLTIRGIEADAVTDGGKALDFIGRGKYDVVVLDLKMPGISGLAVLKTIKRDHPEVAVLMVTGHGSVEENKEGLKAGAFDYLIKPVSIQNLITKIQDAAASKRRK